MLQQVFHSQKKSLDYEEEKRRRILILSFINNISFDMTWNSRKRTSLIVNHELLSVKKRLGAEKKENFLTLNRHTMEVPKKSNQSIIPNKKRANSYAKKTTCNQDLLWRRKRKEIFCTIEYYSFFCFFFYFMFVRLKKTDFFSWFLEKRY